MRERESEREKTMRDIGHGQQEKFPCECLFWFFSIALELHTHIYEDYDRMIYATWYPCKRSFEIKQRPAFLGFSCVSLFHMCISPAAASPLSLVYKSLFLPEKNADWGRESLFHARAHIL